MRKAILTVVGVAALVIALPSIASEGETHAHKAPHGGMVKSAGKFHIELVKTGTGFEAYLLDEKESTLPVEGVSGKATCLTKTKTKLELDLAPEKDHMVIKTEPETLEGGTVIVALRRSGESISAKFNLAGHEHHDEHGHH